MRKLALYSLATSLITLSSTNTLFASDEKYPAANFEPSVVYIDKDYSNNNDSSISKPAKAVDEKFPAANFEPTIVYMDKDYSDNNGSSLSKPAKAVDEKYPAANFEPSVVYMDKDYETNSTSSNSAASQNTNVSEQIDPKYPAANFQPKIVYPQKSLELSAQNTAFKIANIDKTEPGIFLKLYRKDLTDWKIGTIINQKKPARTIVSERTAGLTSF